MNEKFSEFRDRYKSFSYNGYTVEKNSDSIDISFDFEIDGLCSFKPATRIMTGNLDLINRFDSATAKRIVFSLGMVEAVSYWKASCAPVMKVRCGSLSDSDRQWWKKLYYNGLGEFFYRNSIDVSFEDFVNIECGCPDADGVGTEFRSSGINIIPVGGGKDSNVTMELLKSEHDRNLCFTVNDQGARTESAAAAGYGEDRTIKTFRSIDPGLLELNARGFLNGHTPFSAIVAFLGYYCAYLVGAENIVLSNEASANEANINGTQINHQYSKSYEFECDFNAYTAEHFKTGVRYFSLLRAFNELQIAKYFAACSKYHKVFKSCNAGSKKNIWCGECAKCLFVFIILSPFLSSKELTEIFGCNMLDKSSMKADFDGLTGISDVKPFECIGTVSEIRCALDAAVVRYTEAGEPLPYLLDYFSRSPAAGRSDIKALLGEFNTENNIPEHFKDYIAEMYRYVSETE